MALPNFLSNANVASRGPLGSTPPPVPEEIQQQIQANPIPSSMRLVDPGYATTYEEPPQAPRYGLEPTGEATFSEEMGVPVNPNYSVEPVDSIDHNNSDYQDQAYRLAEPTVEPLFNTPEQAAETMRAATSQVGEMYKGFKLDKLKRSEGVEANALSFQANSLQNQVVQNEGIWKKGLLGSMSPLTLPTLL